MSTSVNTPTSNPSAPARLQHEEQRSRRRHANPQRDEFHQRPEQDPRRATVSRRHGAHDPLEQRLHFGKRGRRSRGVKVRGNPRGAPAHRPPRDDVEAGERTSRRTRSSARSSRSSTWRRAGPCGSRGRASSTTSARLPANPSARSAYDKFVGWTWIGWIAGRACATRDPLGHPVGGTPLRVGTRRPRPAPTARANSSIFSITSASSEGVCFQRDCNLNCAITTGERYELQIHCPSGT